MWVRAFFNSYKRRVIAAGGVIQNEPCAVRSLNNNLLRSASWTLIPSGIEEDIVFAQKPTSGLGDLTFTRASDATYTDSTGVVRRSPYNLLTFSEMFSDGVYTKVATTITANTIVAPNGTLTADKLVSTSASSSHSVYQNLGNIGDVRTISCFVKKAEYRYVNLQYGTAVTRFDFDTLTFSGGTGNSYIDAGDGWYRISSILTATVNARASIAIPDNSGNVSYVGDNVSGTFIWGFQAVEGTSALDYFPTTNRQDVPRIDFRNADGTLSSCGRLLLEPQRTNRVLYSEQFDNAAWVKSVATVTANTTISPDGNQNADTIAFTASAIAFCQQIVAGAFESQSHTVSVYAKVASGTATFRLKCTHGGVTDYFSSDFTATTTWQRFTFTATFGATIGTSIVCGVINGTNALAKNVIFYGFQTEANASYATTYIPTTTAAVTRIADVASKTGVSSLIGQTEGTLFVNVDNNESETAVFVSLSNASASVNNHIWLGQVGTNIALFVRSSGTYSILASSITSATGVKKIALAYGASFARLYVNGTQVFDSTAAVIPSGMDKIEVNNLNTSIDVGRVSLAQAALFPTRLTNAQLAEITTL
jgi:hypothetical protein